MPRVKRGVIANKRRKNLLKKAKGYNWRRKTNFRAAKEALLKAGKYAHRDRRAKKRSFRSLWIVRLNNALRLHGLTYRSFIALEKSKNIELDRKVLSELAKDNPKIFQTFIESIK
ncbi:MAG: 50S ribosomal protein L20 [Candidatus Moraniibacteriota bacterium]|nr:MAG: 50S ribosomal protein L20 [Candidatus Moranbacteria bacterium]